MPFIYNTCSLHKLLALNCFSYSCTTIDRIISKCTYFFRLSNVTFFYDLTGDGVVKTPDLTGLRFHFTVIPFIPEYNFKDEVVAIRCSRYDLLRWKRNIAKY